MLNLWHEHEFHSDTFFYPFANAIVELANVVVDAILFVLFDAHCPQHKQCMKSFFSPAGRLCIRTEIYLHILIVNAANANHWRNFFSFVRSFFQPFAFGAAMSKCGQRKKVPTGCVSVIITRSTECAKKVEYKFYLCTMCVFCSIVRFFSLSFLCFSCLWNIQQFATESFDVWVRCEKLVRIEAVCWLKMTKPVFSTLFMHIKWP